MRQPTDWKHSGNGPAFELAYASVARWVMYFETLIYWSPCILSPVGTLVEFARGECADIAVGCSGSWPVGP